MQAQGQCQEPQLQGKKNQDQSLPEHPAAHKAPNISSSTGKCLGLQDKAMFRGRVDREAFLLETGRMVCILGTENGDGQYRKEAVPILGPIMVVAREVGNGLSLSPCPYLCLFSLPCPAQHSHSIGQEQFRGLSTQGQSPRPHPSCHSNICHL